MRPALERLRDAVAAGNLDRLYVHSPDRLARRYAYQVLLIDEFHRAGVEIVFLNRPIGLSPEDDLLLQVQGMVAEYERAKILERSRRGKRHAARQGAVSVLSGAPYGYRYVGKRDDGRGPLRDPGRRGSDRAADLRVDRPRAHQHRRGVPASPAGGLPDPQRQAGLGSHDRVGHPRNPAYAERRPSARPGSAHAGPVAPGARRQRTAPPGPRGLRCGPERVDQRTGPAAGRGGVVRGGREQLAENRRRNRQHARGQRYLLQGLVVCQQCGYAYYGKAISLRSAKGQAAGYAYYRCCGSDAYRFGGERLCANPQVRTDRLDEAVWREVERVLQDPSWIAAEYERRLDQARDPTAADLAGIEAQLPSCAAAWAD